MINLVILMILDNYPFLNYLPFGALDGATEVGPSFMKGLLAQTQILNLDSCTAARIRPQELSKNPPSSAGPKGEVCASKSTLAGET